MFQRDRFDRGKHSERGAGSKDPEGIREEDELEDSDLPPVPDYDDLDLSWGKATMPDFSDEPATSLPVASVDHKKMYAAADAVDSTDATVISSESKAARKARDKDSSGKEEASDATDGGDEKKRSLWTPLIVIAVIMALAAATWFAVTNLDELFGREAAASVNGELITIEELDQRFESIAAQNPAMFDPEMGGIEEGAARQLILEAMIDDVLLMQEAEREGIRISDAEVQEQIDARIATYPTVEDFEEELRANNFTLEMFKQQIRYGMTLEALLEAAVPAASISDEEVRNYYDANIELYTEPAAKRTSHILLPLEDEARATDLLVELRYSDNLAENFARAAEESSADSMSAAAGGDAGWPRIPDQRHPNYVSAVDELAVGEMSELVHTELGLFIILVTDEREESVRDFEEVASGIREMLLATERNYARGLMIDRLREGATIEILDPVIREFIDIYEAPVEYAMPYEGAGAGEDLTDDVSEED